MKNNTRQSLNNGWEFQCNGDPNWSKAEVPGCVHLDLFNLGKIPDPFFGTNEKELQWISEKEWNYRLFFVPDKELQKKKKKRLCFYGIDTYATVYLNGEKIIDANNMFHTWEADVTDIILPERNELMVQFRSPINEILPQLESMDYKLPAENDQAGGTSPYTRKAPFHYGWDWGPCFVTSGIWEKVELFGWDSWFIANVFIHQNTCDKTQAELTVRVDLKTDNNESGKIDIYESKSGIIQEHPFDMKEGDNQYYYTLTIDNPDLWWPAGHGDQPLYEFNIKVQSDGYEEQRTKRVGLRNVVIKREKDDKGESFEIHVNGQPVFAKGANWIPADSFTTRLSRKDYEILLQHAVKANMNTLRIWGGGIYEPDCFYDLCDELGILVWQDFMFACSLYPADDEFLKSVKKEIIYQINRLKDHPCIILWCGNNEVASGWLSWGWKDKLPESVWEDYKKLFHELIPETCNELDPSRLYWPSSPGHCLELPETDQVYGRGDNHYWGVWHGGDEFEAFEHNVGRFMSEYGMQSFPDLKTIKTFANEDDMNLQSDVMEVRQKASLGTGNLLKYIEQYYSMPNDFESIVQLSQIMQAEAIQTAVEAHRRNMPFCMGTLYWQFNDCWPAISWSSIDHQGNWKALHYTAKRFFSPVFLSIHESDNLIDICLINDQDHSINADLIIKLFSFDGSVLNEYSKNIEIPAISSSSAFKLNRDTLIGSHDQSAVVLQCELKKDGTLITRNNFFFVKPKDLKLDEPVFEHQYKMVEGRHFIIIHSYSFTYKLHIHCLNSNGVFSDNYFEMLPNETVEIEFEPTEYFNTDDHTFLFELKSIYDLMY